MVALRKSRGFDKNDLSGLTFLQAWIVKKTASSVRALAKPMTHRDS